MIVSIFAGVLFLSFESARACSPAAGMKYPTLKENFEAAKSVVLAVIKKKSPAGGIYKVEVTISKSWKGSLLELREKLVEVTTRPSSTCDPFGQEVAVGETCVLFLDDKNRVFSGITTGKSSFCIPAGAPRLKTIELEFDALLLQAGAGT